MTLDKYSFLSGLPHPLQHYLFKVHSSPLEVCGEVSMVEGGGDHFQRPREQLGRKKANDGQIPRVPSMQLQVSSFP